MIIREETDKDYQAVSAIDLGAFDNVSGQIKYHPLFAEL